MKLTKSLHPHLKTWITAHPIEFVTIFLLLLLAAFTRLYHIREFVIFLGDEGRDALVAKHILIDHQLTLLGPTASVGGFYIGPLYYYMIAPFLLLANFDPVGPAIMVAIIGIATVWLLFWVNRHWFGPVTAMAISFLYSVAPGIVAFSRSSWNPNPMPFFSLLAVISAHFAAIKNNLRFALLAGICYGVAFQLHYLGLLIGPIIAAVTLVNSKVAAPKTWIKLAILELGGFFIGASLYFAFEVRHGFPNIRSVIEFVNRSGATTGIRSPNLLWLWYEINRFNLESILGRDLQALTPALTALFLIAFVLYSIHLVLQKHSLSSQEKTIITYWIIASLGLGMYRGQLHYHYFQLMFPAPFLVLGMLIASLKPRIRLVLSSLVLLSSIFLVINLPIWSQGSNLIDQTQTIANQVVGLSDNQPYNFALITAGNSDHAYRYFLELKGAKPVALEDNVTNQLLVVCELPIEDCQPLGHSLWEIAGFGRAEIVTTVPTTYPHITLFKLNHHPDSQNLIGKPAPQGS